MNLEYEVFEAGYRQAKEDLLKHFGAASVEEMERLLGKAPQLEREAEQWKECSKNSYRAKKKLLEAYVKLCARHRLLTGEQVAEWVFPDEDKTVWDEEEVQDDEPNEVCF